MHECYLQIIILFIILIENTTYPNFIQGTWNMMSIPSSLISNQDFQTLHSGHQNLMFVAKKCLRIRGCNIFCEIDPNDYSYSDYLPPESNSPDSSIIKCWTNQTKGNKIYFEYYYNNL